MTRKIIRYAQEFKNEAVKLALDTSSISQAGDDLGAPVSTLHSWIHQSKLLALDPQAKDSGLARFAAKGVAGITPHLKASFIP